MAATKQIASEGTGYKSLRNSGQRDVRRAPIKDDRGFQFSSVFIGFHEVSSFRVIV